MEDENAQQEVSETPIQTPNLELLKTFTDNFNSSADQTLHTAMEYFRIEEVNGKNAANLWKKANQLKEEQKRKEKEAYAKPWEVLPEARSKAELAGECTQTMADLTAMRAILKYSQSRIQEAREGYRQGEVTLLTDAEKIYRLRALRAIGNLGGVLFKDDALAQTNLPYRQEAGALAEKIADLAKVASPALRKAYQKLLNPLADEQNKLENKGIWSYVTTDKYLGGNMDGNYIAGEVRDFLRDEAWQSLNATPEQTRALYDLVAGRWFRDLYAGGHESDAGTSSAHAFAILHDPRAIPGLVTHLQRFGSGHTSNSVVYSIKEIIENPLTGEDLNRVVDVTSGIPGRILREWLLEPVEWVKELDGYGLASMAQNAEKHFTYYEAAIFARKIAQDQGIEIKNPLDVDPYKMFFWGNFGELYGTKQIEKLLIDNIGQIAPALVKFGALNRENLPVIFNALVNPQNKDYFYLPRLIAQLRFGLDDNFVAKMARLYESQDLKRSVFARTILAEDLFWLSNKEGGKEILERVLSATTGASRDPERMRETMRLLHSLDSLGAFSFTPQETLPQIIEDLREKVVIAVREKMKLTDEEKPALEKKLNYLLESNLIVIIPSLMAQVEGHGNVSAVVQEIGRHIVLGDFPGWRNSLETAQAQLSVLPEDKRSAWLTPVEDVKIAIRLHGEDEARAAAAEAVKRIGAEAKAHIQDVYKLEFSPNRISELNNIASQLVSEIKRSQAPDERRELGIRKRLVDAELRLVEGILQLENLKTNRFDPAKLMDIIEKTKSAMVTLKGLEQPIQDLEQIGKVFTTQERLTTVSTLRAYETDDPVTLFKAGTEPRETCQSWRQGSYNYCLPSYVADANKRVINVENERGEVIARSMAKLIHIRAENGQTLPAILLEPVYTTSETSYVYRAIAQLALAKARSVGTVLVLGKGMVAATGADNTKTIDVLEQEAKKVGFTVRNLPVEVFIPRSYNAYEYSDTLGGAISGFDRYTSLQAVVASPTLQ